jgi:uncharacterized protein
MPETRPPLPFHGQSLAEIARAVEDRRLPPVDQWNPPHCGHSGMRIARDGSWFHEGAPIGRPAMVRLFATVLRREPDGSHVLITPAEKLDIDVELAAFVATAMETDGDGRARRIALRLNTGDVIILGGDHPLRFAGDVPLVRVRHGLEASLSRPVYYELAEIALAEGDDPPGVWSNGAFFALQPDA